MLTGRETTSAPVAPTRSCPARGRTYEQAYRLAYLRDPGGIIVMFAEALDVG